MNDALLDALAELDNHIDGEIRLDPLHRMLYATDASLYAEEPVGVAFPKHRDDIIAIVELAAHHNLPLIPRTAGTSLAGQCVGHGLVLDTSRYMNEILEIDTTQRQVRVQPGVILDELNRALAPHHLFFGPDTSTANRCMIGGMIGNNSCGSHSILYGTTRDYTLEVEAVLADGSIARFGALSPDALEAKLALDSLEGAIYRTAVELVDAHRDAILERFPKPEVKRRNTGYALDILAGSARYVDGAHPFNLAQLLCGSEGTLAITTEATLGLVDPPREERIIAVHFDTLDAALEATVIATHHNPAAVELIDKRTLDATATNIEQMRNRDWLVGDPAAVLVIELYRDTCEALDADAKAVVDDLRSRDMGYAFPILDPPETGKVWALRKAGLGLLMGIPGDVKPITFVEDTAVAVEDLPEYIRRFAALLTRYDTQCVYYAHASVGELHLRPELNPKDPVDIEKMKGIAKDVAELLVEMRGSLSGEHGDGRVRAPFVETMVGPELYQAFRTLKRAFDPSGILNPGKIVDPKPIDADLRYPPGRPDPQIETLFAYTRDNGLLRAVERCNGAGACRKLTTAGGTMCPSYHATLDELHTTRGRANVFRSLLLGSEKPEDAFASHELYEAMELCIGCKGCKSECPASVDMTRLKSEFLQHYHDIHGMPRRNRFFGDPVGGYKLAQTFARLSNWMVKTRLGKAMLGRMMGVHPNRDLPNFTRKTLRKRLKKHVSPETAGRAGEVVLFIDLFTDYNEPEIGIAAVELLEAAGYKVHILDHPHAGRPQLSKGLVRDARALALTNIDVLLPYAQKGTAIVGIEPSEILTLCDEYPELVPAERRDDALIVANQAMLIEQFLVREHAEGRLDLEFDSKPTQILLHGHCHQKAIVGNAPVVQALELVPGWSVEVIPSGCCGMAGSFGYEQEHYELSMKIGGLVLFPAVEGASPEARIAAPGTSCRHQIHDGTGRVAEHPIALLRSALKDPAPSTGGASS